MLKKIQEEYETTCKKRDEVRETLKKLEAEEPKDSYWPTGKAGQRA
jgi:hypothetical protein